MNEILEYYLSAEKIGSDELSYPGKRIVETKKKNLEFGIPIDEEIWQKLITIVDS